MGNPGSALVNGSALLPVGRGANPPGKGRQNTILPNFPQKLYEIENVWVVGEGGGDLPPRSSTAICLFATSTLVVEDSQDLNDVSLQWRIYIVHSPVGNPGSALVKFLSNRR